MSAKPRSVKPRRTENGSQTVQLKFLAPAVLDSPGKRALPSLDEFEKLIAPALSGIHAISKRPFVEGAHELIKRKVELEDLRDHYKQQVPGLRTSAQTHRKVITQIRRAIRAIDAAQKEAAAEDEELLTNLDVMEAQRLLRMAEADLMWVKDQLFPGWIHPGLRKRKEKATTITVPEHARPDIPGFGIVKIDHWLIGKIDELLDRCRNRQKERVKVGREKIIQAVFQIAFPNASRQIDQIKTARLRIRRNRTKK